MEQKMLQKIVRDHVKRIGTNYTSLNNHDY